MPYQPAHDARGLVWLAIANAERAERVHPAVLPHLKAARTQLDAVCAALDIPATAINDADSTVR